jgi:hypothetical protein
MQYFVSMCSGQAQLHHVDNDRYGGHEWTSVRDVLAAHLNSQLEVGPAAGQQAGAPVRRAPLSSPSCRPTLGRRRAVVRGEHRFPAGPSVDDGDR